MQSLYYKAFNFIENSQPNHLGIYFSLLLHLSILLFAVGLPDFFKPKTIPIPQVIPIEILNISDVTSLTPKKENTEIESKEVKEHKLLIDTLKPPPKPTDKIIIKKKEEKLSEKKIVSNDNKSLDIILPKNSNVGTKFLSSPLFV